MKNLLPQLCFLLCCFFYISASAQIADNNPNKTLSPYFLVKSADAAIDQLPLKATSAEVNIAGVIADVSVTQMYVNNGKHPLEAIYVFPGSTNAAVYGMVMQVGQRKITAKIAEKQKARAQYEQAKSEGKRASLLEQDRPNIFSMNVANIMPGDTIRVILHYTELLTPEEGVYQFVYPTVVGPRYVNGKEQNPTTATASPYLHQGESPNYTFGLRMHLAAGMPLQDVNCISHTVNITYPDMQQADIQISPLESDGGNRDFILRYSLRGKGIETGLLLYDDGKEKFFLCIAQPPKRIENEHTPPREYIFIVDVSGSMNGFPLTVSKKLLRNLIAGLNPQDRFNVILFAGTSNILSPQSVAVNSANVDNAIAFIDRQQGSGGTELLPALQKALSLPRNTEGLSRSMVLITDGYIGVEQEAFDLVRNNLHDANLFAFGIGGSVNRFLMEGLAHSGRGTPFIVTNVDESDAAADKFRKYITNPVLTQITAQFKDFEAYDMAPLSIPDVMSDRPVILYGKWRGDPKGVIKLTGYSGDQPFSWDNAFVYAKSMLFGGAENRKVNVSFNVGNTSPDPRNAAIKYLWAREKIRDLSDYTDNGQDSAKIAEVTRLGLDYTLLTAYTSFVAIEEVPANLDPNGLKTINQPLPMPQGVSDLAVGFEFNLEGISGLAPAAHNRMTWVWLGMLALLGFLFYKAWRVKITPLRSAVMLLLAVSLLPSCAMMQSAPEYTDSDTITFILGDDRNGKNLYYTNARHYFQQDPQEKTAAVVTDCHSLSEVHQYLDRHLPRTGPWRRVNLVSHGNQWTGLSCPLAPGSARASAEAIQAARQSGIFRPLSEQSVDTGTQIVVYGCNLGRDSALLQEMSQVFANRNMQCPKLSSPRYFSLFERPADQTAVRRYLADFKYVVFPAGVFPGNKTIAQELATQCPGDTTNWRAALSRLKLAELKEAYVHYFNLPVRWTVLYPDTEARPALATDEGRLQWLSAQPELMAQIRKLGLRPDQFRWTFESKDFVTDDGIIAPSISVEGITTLYGVLQPLTETTQGVVQPLRADLDDARFYGVASVKG